MTLDELLDELEPIGPEDVADAEDDGYSTLHDSLSQMLVLADRAAKAGYRAGQSTEHVSQQVDELRKFMEAEVESREEDLRRARSEIGELTHERDRLVQALMEVADLMGSASEAAHNELDSEVAARFERLESHIEKVLSRAGLEPMASEGESFDPEFHEAIDQVVREGTESRSIVQVVRQGYRYRGEPVRIARVIIAE